MAASDTRVAAQAGGLPTADYSVQAEELQEIVRTAADNYGGVLGGLRREIAEFRDEWRKNAEVTDMALADHARRIIVLEQTTGASRE